MIEGLFNQWLFGDCDADVASKVRKYVKEVVNNRWYNDCKDKGDAWREESVEARLTIHYIDFIEQELTAMVMDGMLGRNQEEKLASKIALMAFTDDKPLDCIKGKSPNDVYSRMDAYLQGYRVYLRPEDVI